MKDSISSCCTSVDDALLDAVFELINGGCQQLFMGVVVSVCVVVPLTQASNIVAATNIKFLIFKLLL